MLISYHCLCQRNGISIYPHLPQLLTVLIDNNTLLSSYITLNSPTVGLLYSGPTCPLLSAHACFSWDTPWTWTCWLEWQISSSADWTEWELWDSIKTLNAAPTYTLCTRCRCVCFPRATLNGTGDHSIWWCLEMFNSWLYLIVAAKWTRARTNKGILLKKHLKLKAN